MARNFMAYPELRYPFEETPIHAEGQTTVLYQGNTIRLEETGSGEGLLIRPEDLPLVNGFELKPEGACYQDMCIPLNDRFFIERDGRQWFDLKAFADLIEQPCVADEEDRVWSFGEIPAKRESMMVDAMAPDFEVTDRQGNVVRMSDFKGKKALVVTWSSW
ncbi:MAG: redoxin domain-containing protein [Gammaproteobacteria bacterium]|nr:redoxin domain-containing protein [Gammaproteobacteria bacterium]